MQNAGMDCQYFSYKKGSRILMIDAGCNYERQEEKMGWLDFKPVMIHGILMTHQDTDHIGDVEEDSSGLFRSAKLYIDEIENSCLTGEEKVLVKDGGAFLIGTYG